MFHPDTLIVVRCGRGSLHPSWIASALERCDVALVAFDDAEFPGAEPTHVARYPGTKLTGCRDFLRDRPDLVARYAYFWLVEDDLFLPGDTIAGMLRFKDRVRPALCAPALTPYSFYTHAVMLRNEALFLRGTDFVECMAPLMSRAFLTGTLDQFAEFPIYGIERYWQHLLWEMREVAYILDAFPIVHTRPVGQGSLYRLAERMGVDVGADDRRAARLYGGRFNRYINTLFGVRDGTLAEPVLGAELREMRRIGFRPADMAPGRLGQVQHEIAQHTGFTNDLFSRFLSFPSVRALFGLPPVSEAESDIMVRRWAFGRLPGDVYVNGIRLGPHGRIEGYAHPNESGWALRDGALVLLSKDGEVTTRFTERGTRDGRQTWTGPMMLDSQVRHFLLEVEN